MSHLSVQDLSASLDGVLAGPAMEQVVAHLASCHLCRDNQARLVKHDDALRRLLAQDPDDSYLDDLARRSETLVHAVLSGTPEPPIVTSVPLQDEEDPDAPLEPPLPSDLARAGERATAAGFGVIGVRPAAPVRAPHADTGELHRLMQAIEGGQASLPPAPAPPAAEEIAPEASRPEPVGAAAPAEPPVVEDPTLAGRLAYEAAMRAASGRAPAGAPPRSEAAPRSRAPAETGNDTGRGFAHGGAWSADPPSHERVHPTGAERFAPPAKSADPFAPATKREPAWSRMGLEPDPLDPGTYREPITDAMPIGARGAARHRSSHRTQLVRASVIAALTTVGGLLALAIVLRLQGGFASSPGDSEAPSLLGVRMPRVQLLPNGGNASAKDAKAAEPRTAKGAATSPSPDVREAATRGAVETVVPRGAGSTSSTAATSTGPSVCGQVVNMAGEPVADVLFSVGGSSATTYGPVPPVHSDTNGHFCLSASPGSHVVVIQGVGLSPQRITVDFADGAPDLRILVR